MAMKRRGEMRLIEQAIRGGWDVPEKSRIAAVALIKEIIDDPKATDREILRAANLAILMEEANLKAREPSK